MERRETITDVTCNNAEGTFLPPYIIMKNVNLKDEFADGLPSSSQIRMNRKSAYINSYLFMDWMKSHFVSHKLAGKSYL